jgi:hypothetical protein
MKLHMELDLPNRVPVAALETEEVGRATMLWSELV